MKVHIPTANGHIQYGIEEGANFEEKLKEAKIHAGTVSLLHNAAVSHLVDYEVKKNTLNNLIIKMTSPITSRECVAQIRKRGRTYTLDIIEGKHEASAAEYPKKSQSLGWLFWEHEDFLGAFLYEVAKDFKESKAGKCPIKLYGFDKLARLDLPQLFVYSLLRDGMEGAEEAYRYLTGEGRTDELLNETDTFLDFMKSEGLEVSY